MHRLVVNLVRLGFLVRDQPTTAIDSDLLLAEFGTIGLSRMGLRDRARPKIDRLISETREVL